MLENLTILSFFGVVLCLDTGVMENGESKTAISEVSNITVTTPPSDVYLEKPFNQPISNFSI